MKVVTLLNCIDGLFQDAGLTYVRDKNADFIVDNITYPGMDNVFNMQEESVMNVIKYSIDISISRGSNKIYLSGHSNCTGNVKTDSDHLIDVRNSIKYLNKIYPNIEIKGMFIQRDYKVKEVI